MNGPVGRKNGLKGMAVNAPVAVFTDHALTVLLPSVPLLSAYSRLLAASYMTLPPPVPPVGNGKPARFVRVPFVSRAAPNRMFVPGPVVTSVYTYPKVGSAAAGATPIVPKASAAATAHRGTGVRMSRILEQKERAEATESSD